MRQRTIVAFGEGGSDEILIQRGFLELLLYIGHAGFQIQRLVRALNNRPADAASVGLLQVQPLGEIMVVGRLSETVEARPEVFIALGVGMVNGGLQGWRVRLRYLSV